ncbi:hypothetical protein ANN_01661 [Periplaneta americana]|uniref:Reverse transcriptase domain-containing protein n=1 Tax=Periplaneta americana TaxID=6978 RepID=A0ABQ8TX30_PERAM|nr:hypothetical protein ANN_01661 [Periplaneta americana]
MGPSDGRITINSDIVYAFSHTDNNNKINDFATAEVIPASPVCRNFVPQKFFYTKTYEVRTRPLHIILVPHSACDTMHSILQIMSWNIGILRDGIFQLQQGCWMCQENSFFKSEDVISYPENTQSDHISFHPMKEWEEKLCHIQSVGTSEDFEALMEDVRHFLTQQMTELPGPQHPAVKHYQARKFYNQRRKVARKVLHNLNHKATCKISTRLITEHIEHVFSTTDNSSPLSDEDEDSIQFPEDIVITESDIHKALFGIKVDTSPGPDRITVRVLRHLKATKFLTLLANTMLHFNHVPKFMKLARTILIHKGDDVNDIKHWRPITIHSVIRRVIERALDIKLRSYIVLNAHQRGFINIPGTHINASLINGCLQSSKLNKKDCCVVFLDVSKAFDSVGHEHILRALKSSGVPQNLFRLIGSLLTNNTIQIETNHTKTKPISSRISIVSNTFQFGTELRS